LGTAERETRISPFRCGRGEDRFPKRQKSGAASGIQKQQYHISKVLFKGKDNSVGSPLWRKTHEARPKPSPYLNINLLMEQKKALLEKCGSSPQVATRHHENRFSQE
jgi:hypothetical protein